jgi:hypothetical protein
MKGEDEIYLSQILRNSGEVVNRYFVMAKWGVC